MTMQSTETFLP